MIGLFSLCFGIAYEVTQMLKAGPDLVQNDDVALGRVPIKQSPKVEILVADKKKIFEDRAAYRTRAMELNTKLDDYVKDVNAPTLSGAEVDELFGVLENEIKECGKAGLDSRLSEANIDEETFFQAIVDFINTSCSPLTRD